MKSFVRDNHSVKEVNENNTHKQVGSYCNNGNECIWENDKGNMNVDNVNDTNGVKFPGNNSTSNKYTKTQVMILYIKHK